MDKRNIIERGQKAKQLQESAFFHETIEAVKVFAIEQLGKTAPAQVEERERLHGVLYNFNLVDGQLQTWINDAEYVANELAQEGQFIP